MGATERSFIMDMKDRFSRMVMLAAALLAMTAASCTQSAIFDDQGDCSVHFKVKFRYDMNMEFADAFHSHVGSVTLYAFGEDGKLVWQNTESGEELGVEGWMMDVELEPGTYDLLAWCGLEEGEHFKVPEAVVGQTVITDMKCRLERAEAEVKDDINDLFHGTLHAELAAKPGTHIYTMPLIKNTNSIRVNLHHLSEAEINPADFRFEILDDNGHMDWDNSLLDDEMLTYRPWSIASGSVDADTELPSKAGESLNLLMAEFTVARLMTTQNPVLHIYNDKLDRKVLTIPLNDYFLAVRSANVASMDEQEFLDRNDDYSLTVLLDKHLDWVSVAINIHSWRLVKYNQSLQ